MKKNLEVIYENGVFRPLEPVDLPEHQQMTVTIGEAAAMTAGEEWLDLEYERLAATEATEEVSLEAVRRALAKILGSLTVDFMAERAEV
jgi:predicted DNA-binding antitoxin AbrB/MazE fold protein